MINDARWPFPGIPENFYADRRPPGLMGEIVDFTFKQAPNPIYEVALAGGIALFAGIVGRQFNFSGDGLNQYILLVADTGMGKDAAKAGMNKIVGKVVKSMPAAASIMGPAEFASGPALLKSMARRHEAPCYVSVVGEIGIKLQQMTKPNSPEPAQTLMRALLQLYTLSGSGRTLDAYEYADQRETTNIVKSPALTILGEGTGSTTYEALDERQITNGLISRFTVIEYDGECPEFNKEHGKAEPSDEMIERMREFVTHVFNRTKRNEIVVVEINNDADALLDEIREYARRIINSKSGDVINSIWTRVSQKVGRLAALLAVSLNWRQPVIDADMIKWAASLVLKDTRRLERKFKNGELGVADESDDDRQIEEVRKVIVRFLARSHDDFPSEKLRKLRMKETIPYSYVSQSVLKLAAFRKDRRKATPALNAVLSTLCSMGVLQEGKIILDENDLGYGNSRHGRGFMIVDSNWVHGIEEERRRIDGKPPPKLF